MKRYNGYVRTTVSFLLALMLVVGGLPAFVFAETAQEAAADDVNDKLTEESVESDSAAQILDYEEAINPEEKEIGNEESVDEEIDYSGDDQATDNGTEKVLNAMGSDLKAASAEVQVSDNEVIVVGDYNSSKGSNPTDYTTALKYNSDSYSRYITSTNYFQVPSRGTLLITYKEAVGGADCSVTVHKDNVEYSRIYYPYSGDAECYCCYMNAAGRIKVDFDSYIGSGKYGCVAFNAIFVPDVVNSMNINKSGWTDYYHGGPGTTSATSAFNIKVPGNGYLEIMLYDETGQGNSVYFITSGFDDYEYLSSRDYRRAVGVTAGNYNIKVKTNAPIYRIKARFIGISENKYGTKKKKAATVKKKRTIKGVIATNNRKAHWYKIKLKKKQTIKLNFRSDLTGTYGGLRLTAYKGKKKIGNVLIRQDDKTNQFIIYRGSMFSRKKLTKGTYYLKIESYKRGNGYFSFNWK